jgi:hypothetical protein
MDATARVALSCRAIEREYHVSRSLPASLARQGVLPALRRGRALLILRADWESWWRTQSAVAHDVIQRRVAEVLARRAP